ncbi:MAG: transcription elongation factor GreB [Gammaproteobacteria bacterium]|nr:transcription elongation factor GreB [Gammaproteobacteria bacterium]
MSAPYITPDGFHKLKSDYDQIWKRRSEVVSALSDAAAEGDRSENAEYIYRKKELRQLDYKIRYLQNRLEELCVVNEVNDNDHVYFGAWVSLESKSGNIISKRIVGFDELDNDTDYISIDSPLARALLNKKVDNVIEYSIKNAKISYKIISIRYR